MCSVNRAFMLLLRGIPLNNGIITWKFHTTINGCIEFYASKEKASQKNIFLTFEGVH